MHLQPRAHTASLRLIERRVLRLREDGVSTAEIGRRFGRSAEAIEQMFDLIALHDPDAQTGDVLNALERRVLRWRAQGMDHDELASRFLRSADHLSRVKQLAHYKLARPTVS